MAKSKDQKRTEAIARLRQQYSRQHDIWARSHGNKELFLKHYGQEAADKMIAEAERTFARFLHQAHLDRSGNPLD